ncbi:MULTISPECIES: flavodoxin [unclassified Mesorhizobium]|uniref:flavodoxin n=1 Tax=unclassified Mesorhizobium TaxID=325217 RepID=UPI00112B888E|nr:MULTISPECIES: flavodoxin [unclassified Mesorhizobium]TPM89656.1 flavodoxin [Mesorhizobium sp. B2-1-5]TPN31877.1 flavodoxin [Mesorhizobium sp. B1-1-6]
MTDIDNPARRKILMSSLLLPLAAGAGALTSPATAASEAGSKTLVAYFSRSGNTRTIAGLLSRDLGADLFEIEPARPYPADYFETVEQARKERERDYLPPLKAIVRDLAPYDAVFLGFPVWGGSAPSVIRSFLAAHDFTGLAVVPFNLHGGFGLGDSLEVITRAAPQARFAEGFVMEGLQERRTTESVRKWLTKVSVDK